MYKNQLQELAQRSCFNLPSYACIREGPDHAPRFKASVNFNGEVFDSPSYCTTLRQAEHAAAEVALNVLSTRGPSRSLTARVLDETGIYKNLLQETAHRAGLNLPVYTTVRSGPGHVPIFTCTVELAGMHFTGESAKTKKQAEKNAAIAAWSSLKRMPNLDSLTDKETDKLEEQDQAIVARVLSNFGVKDDPKNRINNNARRRDQIQNQARRRMVYSSHHHRDNCNAAAATSGYKNLLQYQQQQQWRFLDILMDSALDVSSISTQKQNSFVSLVPPPPPLSTSKILPPIITSLPPSNRPIPVKVRANNSSSHVKMQEISAAKLEEQQHVKKPIIEKEVSSSKSPVPFPYQFDTSRSQTGTANRLFGSFTPNPVTPSAAAAAIRAMYTGGFNPQRIAPAVKIRSVIPVCAAPPPAATRTRPPPSMKEAANISSSSNSNSSMLINNPSSSLTK